MDLLRRCKKASGTETRTHKDPGDQIYPVHIVDDTKTLRSIVVTWTMRFNDILDVELLRDSLLRLLDIGDWRKLGGRLRMTEDEALQLHVPQRFTTERPALTFSHICINGRISDHPVARFLPEPSDRPAIHPRPDLFREFAARKNAPASLKDYVDSDLPVLSLHCTSFNNATLVAISYPHVLMDIIGQEALLRSWSLVLAGKEAEIPPLIGAAVDFLGCADPMTTSEDVERMRLMQRRLTGLRYASFALRFAWDVFRHPVVETKVIFLPQSSFAALRRRAEADISTHWDDGREVAAKHFISDGDILTAWATRAIASSSQKPRSVTIIHAMNARFRLDTLIRAPGVFVQNMALPAMTFLPPSVALRTLGDIALDNRRQLQEQSKETHIRAVIQDLISQPKGSRDPFMPCGDPNGILIPITNWDKSDLFNSVDFSPALSDRTQNTGSTDDFAGMMTYHHAAPMEVGRPLPNMIVVLGKDRDRNYWLTAMLLPHTWKKIEEELALM